MKAINRKPAISVLTLAVQGALVAMFAMPIAAMAEGDEDVAALTNPTSTIELGVSNTSQSSAKFGEYNGLDKKGTDLIGNVNIKGGDAYGQNTGTTSWSITGVELGTTSRELGATVGSQGSWNFGIYYDQLRHNISDTYQTPYLGGGSNNLTLPAGFGNTATPAVMTAAQAATILPHEVYSERKNSSLKASYDIDSQWGVTFDFNRLKQSGSKLISSASEGSNGTGTRVPLSALNGVAWSAEAMAVLMNPTKSTTDTFNLGLNWTGDQGYLTGGYYGSLYHDDYKGLTWESPFTASTTAAHITNTMGTPPSNVFHQINLKGGYAFSPETHLKGGFSRAHNTQNVAYAGSYTSAFYPAGVPESLDGKVDMTHMDLSLSHRASSDLNLSAGLIYNDRDNTTASNAYTFNYLNGTSTTAYNAPMSYKHTQFDLGADYRIDSSQHLHVGYGYDEMKRNCNAATANVNTVNPSATTCAQVTKETENKLGLDYRLNASDAVTMKLGYSYGKRKSDASTITALNTNGTAANGNVAPYDVGFYNPMQAIALGGSSPGYELAGFMAYFQASRKENQLKANVSWQASPKVSVSLGGKYQRDDYDSIYGVQNGERSSFNFDTTYNTSNDSQLAVFVTTQHRTRNLLDYQPRTSSNATTGYQAGTWSNTLTDDDATLGISAKQDKLMGGKLDLVEELTDSHATTDYTTQLVTATYINPAVSQGSWPSIKTATLQFKLVGSYKLDKSSRVVAGYLFQRVKSNDFLYDSYQTGTALDAFPTNQKSPNYSLSVVSASYVYNF